MLWAYTHACVNFVHIGPYVHSLNISSAGGRCNKPNHLWIQVLGQFLYGLTYFRVIPIEKKLQSI